MSEPTLREIERAIIIERIARYPRLVVCAQTLGISTKTLYNKLHRYGLFEQCRQGRRLSPAQLPAPALTEPVVAVVAAEEILSDVELNPPTEEAAAA